MPTYDYECTKCEAVQEVFHGMNDAPRVRCTDCGATSRKLPGAGAGLLFKGSGFYETDYRSSSYTESAKAERSAPTATPASDSSKSDAKSADVAKSA